MALKQPAREHQRITTVVFDPDQEKKDNPSCSIRQKRVAAYARVSTDQDAQQSSYEAQITYYTDYINSKPEWTFVSIYSDEGISGTSFKKRDGFNRMVEDAMNGKIDLILTKSISRFARNTVDSLSVTRKLKAKGVEVFFEKENISSMDPQAELIFTIMSSVAQEESRSISENVRWGKRRSMEAGNVSIPYSSFLGYEKGPDGLPQIVPEEAELVRYIFRLYLEGNTFKAIADRLTSEGYKTPRNAQCWHPKTVSSILTNEKYKGDARLQKTYVVDFLTKEVRVNHGEVKQWYVKDSHDAIVSPETFELVQREIQRRTARKGRFYDSPFTNKIICGACGGYYGHRVWHSNESYRKNVWICNDKYRGETICRVPRLTDQEIETLFLIALNRLPFKSPEYVDTYEQEFLPLIGDTGDLEEKLALLTDQSNEIIAQIEAMVADNAKRQQDQDVFTAKYGQLKADLEQKQAMVADVKQQISDALARKESARIFLEGIRNVYPINNGFDIPTWHALVEYAKVMPDKTVVFHFRNGLEESVALEEAQ